MTSIKLNRSTPTFALLAFTILLGAGCTSSSDVEVPTRTKGAGSSANGVPTNNSSSNTPHPLDRPTDIRPARVGSALEATDGHSPPTYLNTEATMVLNTGLSSEAARELLGSSRALAAAAEQMERDAASSPEAQDLTAHYRAALIRAIGKDAAVERFSCGLSICIGSVRAGTIADHEAWGERFSSDPSSRSYSYTEAFEDLGAGYQNRFMFSTDPTLNAISGN